MTTLNLRDMRHTDVPALYDWYKTAPSLLYSETTFEISWLYRVQHDQSQYRKSIIYGGQLAGFATLWRNNDFVAGCWSPTILVDPALRGRGIGLWTLMALIGIASKDDRIDEVWAGVYDDNAPSLMMATRVFGAPVAHSKTKSGRDVTSFRMVVASGVREVHA